MNIELTSKNDVDIIKLNGNLVLTGVKDVKEQLKPLFEDESKSRYVINLSSVPMVDSSGIGFLISSFNSIKKRQATLVFCGLNDTMNEIFKSTHLNSIFKIYADEEQALANL